MDIQFGDIQEAALVTLTIFAATFGRNANNRIAVFSW